MDLVETRVLSRVTRELELFQNVPEPVLILNCLHLTDIPNAVLTNQHYTHELRELCLKNNRITMLSNGISKLTALCKLCLPANTLEDLPDVLTDLPCLSLLDVSNNHITSIPPFIQNMKNLTNLNIGNNKLTHLPDELWRIPCLCSLNAYGNQISAISSTIVQCQSLSKLILDCNRLSFLPMQITRLPNLKYLSLSGNKLRLLPNDFPSSVLQTVLLDSNSDLSHIPVSLATVETLGVVGCSVYMKEDDMHFLKPVRICSAVPSLTELAARSLHAILRSGSLRDSAMLWLPKQLCSLLQLPQGLENWLVPTGRCLQCQQVYFHHYFAMLVYIWDVLQEDVYTGKVQTRGLGTLYHLLFSALHQIISLIVYCIMLCFYKMQIHIADGEHTEALCN